MSTHGGTDKALHARELADANRSHYNENAHHFDDRRGAQELGKIFATGMKTMHEFDQDRTTVLDFACGTGVLSRELAQHTQQIVGLDISEKMVDEYNKRVEQQGILAEEMQALRGDLQDPPPELTDKTFHVVVCASSYHHFEDLADVSRGLAKYLAPGGALLVGDLLHEDGANDIFPVDVHHIVAHRGGLPESAMRDAFQQAGLIDFAFKEVGSAEKFGRPVKFFVAKGSKPKSE